MNSALFMGVAIAQFDRELFDKLKLRKTTQECVSQEPLRIGIRNEFGHIYRMVGTSKQKHFDKILQQLNDMGFVDELVENDAAAHSYSAIFDNVERRIQFTRSITTRSVSYSNLR